MIKEKYISYTISWNVWVLSIPSIALYYFPYIEVLQYKIKSVEHFVLIVFLFGFYYRLWKRWSPTWITCLIPSISKLLRLKYVNNYYKSTTKSSIETFLIFMKKSDTVIRLPFYIQSHCCCCWSMSMIAINHFYHFVCLLKIILDCFLCVM